MLGQALEALISGAQVGAGLAEVTHLLVTSLLTSEHWPLSSRKLKLMIMEGKILVWTALAEGGLGRDDL